MITRITGIVTELYTDYLVLEIGAFGYEVLIPEFARRQLQSQLGKEVSLCTIQYIDGNPTQGRMTPRLVGFLSAVEREFFELFCSVDGVGTKKALRAMVRPVNEVAAAIEDQNAKLLSSLPGIGPATAERIIAKLRRKVPKFALMVSQNIGTDAEQTVTRDIISDTFEALLALGHSESDARHLIDTVLEKGKKFKDVQDVLQAIYYSR
ncbi:MAG: Holliday junction branch migration protein RuvA [Planctomycetia bacterium]|nr:Holliday junction branch migration protein RuvA [Planctomycetia bacterium]